VWVARQPDGSKFDEGAERHPTRATESAARVEDLVSERGEKHGFDAALLRTGLFYGPADGMTRQFAGQLLAGDLPVIGGGVFGRQDAELSLVHVDDAASAVGHAVASGVDGCYNVVDSEPVTVADYLRRFADLLGAPEPSRVPWWLARPFAGKDAVRFMTSPMPTTSERFCEGTGWQPTYETYREGLKQTVETWREDGTLAELRDRESSARTEASAGSPA
jgi:nucleoside-diphosphate-sugar epimerase